MQTEITTRTDFLDKEGKVVASGWARDDLFNYDRSKISVNGLRIKAWDFWEVYNSTYRVIMNIYDIGYAGGAQFTFTDFETGKSVNECIFKLFPLGSIGNPKSWRYKEPLRVKNYCKRMEFSKNGNIIRLECDFPKAMKGKGISGDIKLLTDPGREVIANLIPFKDPRQFAYAVKMNCLSAVGSLRIGDRTVGLSQGDGSWGVLDWTRAVFPYKNRWKWCTASGEIEGAPFGFNLDYGFGTDSSKNMLFYNNKGHHLDQISYQHDKENLKKDLIISSSDNRINLVLHPSFVEKPGIDAGVLAMKGVCTYGFFTGEVVLDGGRRLAINENDRLFGWAEEYYQKW